MDSPSRKPQLVATLARVSLTTIGGASFDAQADDGSVGGARVRAVDAVTDAPADDAVDATWAGTDEAADATDDDVDVTALNAVDGVG